MVTQADACPEYSARAPVGAASAEVLEMAAHAPHLDFTPTLTRLRLEEIVQAASRPYPAFGHADLLAAYWRDNNV